jgi:hypothetical protein
MRSLFVLLIITALTTKSWGEFYLDASRCEFGKINFQASNLQGANDYISEEFVELYEGDVLYVLNFRANNTVFRVTIASNGQTNLTDGDVGIYTRDSDDGEYIDAISFRGGSGVEFLSSAYSGLYLVGPTKVYIGLPFSTISQSYSQYASGDTNAFECSIHYAIQRKRVVNPQVVNN